MMTPTATMPARTARPDRTIVLRMMTDRIARRLLTIEEAAPLLGYSVRRLEDFVGEGSLPVVRLPSASDEATRWCRRIPVVWLHRWFDMRGKGHPQLTERKAIGGQPGEPLMVSVATTAAAINLTPKTVYQLIECGRFAPPIETPAGIMRIAVADFDDWIFELIRKAEEVWYGLVEQEAGSA